MKQIAVVVACTIEGRAFRILTEKEVPLPVLESESVPGPQYRSYGE